MESLINELLERINHNMQDCLAKIKMNQSGINKYVTKKREGGNPEESNVFDVKFGDNAALIRRYGDLIILREQLRSYINKNSGFQSAHEIKTTQLNLKQNHSYDEMFEMTINGKVSYDKNHPYYNEKLFVDRLMQYYIKTERYEKCIELKNAN